MKNQFGTIVIGVCIALAGYFMYLGLSNFTSCERLVTSRGLCEREVMADKAVWSISYSVSGNQLESLYDRLEPKKKAIVDFFKANGIKDEEIVFKPSYSVDRSSMYNWGDLKGKVDQYELNGRMTIVTHNVENVRQLHLRQADLLKSGVALEQSNMEYDYTGLNELKPEMVEEATSNARIVANKFAKDAGCELGSIKTARQGQFEVYGDDVLPHMCKIRVVTTIEYYLK